MKGYDIYKKAVLRLGYNEGINERLLERTPELMNQIAADLKLPEIKNLSENVAFSSVQIEALCCGTAMLLALCEGDGAKNKLFADIYNAKRAAVLSEITCVEDTLPIAESGGY